jgi:hypothetical protein
MKKWSENNEENQGEMVCETAEQKVLGGSNDQ